jgi:flagellar biosynthesis anti-sigma factor FlgM
MSNINAVGGNSPVQKIVANPVQRSGQTETQQQPTPPADRVEISGVGAMLKTLKAGGDFRADKVADIKARIEAGTYEDDAKLDAAADKLLDDLMK